MLVNIQLQNLGLVMIEEKTSLPLTMLNFHLVHIRYTKDRDSNGSVLFTTHNINGSVFSKVNDFTLCQRNLLGTLSREVEYEISSQPEQTITGIVDHVKEITRNLLSKGFDNSEFQLVLKVKLDAAGNKRIEINLMDFRCLLVTSSYISIIDFVKPGDSFNSPASNKEFLKAKESILSATRRKSMKEIVQNKGSNQLSLNASLKNITIAMPSSIQRADFTNQILALRGDWSIALEMLPAPNLEDERNAIGTKKIANLTEQACPQNKIMKILVTLNKFEVFISKFEEVMNSEDFSEVRKRTIIMPFTMLLLHEGYSILNATRSKLIPYNRTKIELDKFVLRFTYHDFKLLFSSLDYQIEQLSIYRKTMNEDKMLKRKEDNSKQAEIHSADNMFQDSVFEESKMKEEEKVVENGSQELRIDEYFITSQGLQTVTLDEISLFLILI